MNTEVLNVLKKSSIYSGRYSLETFHFCTKSVKFASFLLLHKFTFLSLLFITGKGLCIQLMKVIIDKYVIKKVVILFSLLDFFSCWNKLQSEFHCSYSNDPRFALPYLQVAAHFFPLGTMTIVVFVSIKSI